MMVGAHEGGGGSGSVREGVGTRVGEVARVEAKLVLQHFFSFPVLSL